MELSDVAFDVADFVVVAFLSAMSTNFFDEGDGFLFSVAYSLSIAVAVFASLFAIRARVAIVRELSNELRMPRAESWRTGRRSASTAHQGPRTDFWKRNGGGTIPGYTGRVPSCTNKGTCSTSRGYKQT